MVKDAKAWNWLHLSKAKGHWASSVRESDFQEPLGSRTPSYQPEGVVSLLQSRVLSFKSFD